MCISPSKSALARPRRWWGRKGYTLDITVSGGTVARLAGKAMYEYLGFMIARSLNVGARAEWRKVYKKMDGRVARLNACRCTMRQRALAAKFMLISIAAYRANYLPFFFFFCSGHAAYDAACPCFPPSGIPPAGEKCTVHTHISGMVALPDCCHHSIGVVVGKIRGGGTEYQRQERL